MILLFFFATPLSPSHPRFFFGMCTGFMNAHRWLADVREHADPHLTCILVGNKVDLCEPSEVPSSSLSAPPSTSTPSDSPSAPSTPLSPLAAVASTAPAAALTASQRRRQVPTSEASEWATQEGLLFVEASAKSGRNVDQAFEDASRDILDKIRRGVFDDDRVGFVSALSFYMSNTIFVG